MNVPLLNPTRVKVLCDLCLKQYREDCEICDGFKYYYWDPDTYQCFLASGEPIVSKDENGDVVEVVRKPSDGIPAQLSLEIMLGFIELWVAENSVRYWKLSYNQDGWNARVWFNKFKKQGVEKRGATVLECVTKCYEEILSRSEDNRY